GASGWRIITVSRQPFSVLCQWPGGGANPVQLDLGDPAERAGGTEEIRHRLAGDGLHALVNNAAISPKGPKGERLGAMDTPFDLRRHGFNVNFFGPVRLA